MSYNQVLMLCEFYHRRSFYSVLYYGTLRVNTQNHLNVLRIQFCTRQRRKEEINTLSSTIE